MAMNWMGGSRRRVQKSVFDRNALYKAGFERIRRQRASAGEKASSYDFARVSSLDFVAQHSCRKLPPEGAHRETKSHMRSTSADERRRVLSRGVSEDVPQNKVCNTARVARLLARSLDDDPALQQSSVLRCASPARGVKEPRVGICRGRAPASSEPKRPRQRRHASLQNLQACADDARPPNSKSWACLDHEWCLVTGKTLAPLQKCDPKRKERSRESQQELARAFDKKPRSNVVGCRTPSPAKRSWSRVEALVSVPEQSASPLGEPRLDDRGGPGDLALNPTQLAIVAYDGHSPSRSGRKAACAQDVDSAEVIPKDNQDASSDVADDRGRVCTTLPQICGRRKRHGLQHVSSTTAADRVMDRTKLLQICGGKSLYGVSVDGVRATRVQRRRTISDGIAYAKLTRGRHMSLRLRSPGQPVTA